ncbi:MAG: glycosyltransferase [Pseudomonadota bacterium]
MKILVVGPFGSPQRDEAIARGFRECGATVMECSYGDVLYSTNLLTRIQLRLSAGPVCQVLAKRVSQAAQQFQPDVILFRRPLEFTPAMLRYIKKQTPALLASFNNDDPFSPAYKDRRWRMLRAAVPLFDLHFAFRRRNIEQYKAHGAKAVALWEPFYSPWLHRPLIDSESLNANETAILFAMHAERDARRDAVVGLRQAGLKVDVHSWNWGREFGEDDARAFSVMPPIWGDDYVRAVGNSMATLCFFSKQNGDELTSRVFEIPACGGLLAAERNERIGQLFKGGEEAILFTGIGDLVGQLCQLSKNPVRLRQMKKNARARLLADRHSVVDRCADAMAAMQQVQEEKTISPGTEMIERKVTSSGVKSKNSTAII